MEIKNNIFENIKKIFIFVLYLLIFCTSAFASWLLGLILVMYAYYEGALFSSPFFLFTMAVELILFALNYIYLDKVYNNKYKILISLFSTFTIFILVFTFVKYIG